MKTALWYNKSNLTDKRENITLSKKSTNKKTENKEGDYNATLKYVIDSFNKSWKYTESGWHDRWERNYKLYNNTRVKRGYEGVSDIFVPMTFSTIETMVSALASGKPTVDYLPHWTNPEQDMKPLNSLFDDYWDKDQWNIKIQNFIRSMLIDGTSVLYVMWDINHPVLVNIPIRDFFFNPTASNIENTGADFFCGRRYLTTVEDLKSFEIVDPETGEMKPKYMNLEEVKNSSEHGAETAKEKKDMFYGSTVKGDNDQVEVIELWTDTKVCSVANRSVVIEESENPYLAQSRRVHGNEKAKGIIPFVLQRDYVDESLLLGKGEVEQIADLQEWLNDITNQKNDAVTYVLNPMWNLNPTKSDLIEQIGAAPGRVFPLDSNDLTPVSMPSIPSEAYTEPLSVKNEIRETTAISEVTKGVNTDTNQTATEINAQMANAGQRISMKITQLENEALHRLARIIFAMSQLYITEPIPIRIESKDGTQVWSLFDPNDFPAEYQPKVMLQSSVEQKQRNDVNKSKEMYLALAADPEINQIELKKIMLPKMFDLDTDEVERLLNKPEPLPAPNPVASVLGSQMQPDMQGTMAGIPQ